MTKQKAKNPMKELTSEIATTLTYLPREVLLKAPWNYKEDGDEEDRALFKESILKDKSCGVMAVRPIKKKGSQQFYEVMDGNHRLDILEELDWKMVPCEVFPEGTEVDTAFLISRRRNHQWFKDNPLKLGAGYRVLVLPKHSWEELSLYMPDKQEDMETWMEKAKFNMTPDGMKAGGENWGMGGGSNDGSGKSLPPLTKFKEIQLLVPETVQLIWEQVRDRIGDSLGIHETGKVFEIALLELLRVDTKDLAERYAGKVDE